jgi:hypothetical protein
MSVIVYRGALPPAVRARIARDCACCALATVALQVAKPPCAEHMMHRGM